MNDTCVIAIDMKSVDPFFELQFSENLSAVAQMNGRVFFLMPCCLTHVNS